MVDPYCTMLLQACWYGGFVFSPVSIHTGACGFTELDLAFGVDSTTGCSPFRSEQCSVVSKLRSLLRIGQYGSPCVECMCANLGAVVVW